MNSEEREIMDLAPMQGIADDFLIQVAEQAERRIDAVIKIKKTALKVTNIRDWTSQQDNPYLQVSGSEKIANLFNISWRIDEPVYDEEPDGHYTYSYKGYFSLGGRTIEAEGSRSSHDPFFTQYRYKDEQGNELKPRQEVPITQRTNKRDVKMAALTNLLGNGITRILGIRNLTWEDLKEFAGITKEQVIEIQYAKHGAPIQEPQKKDKNAPKPGTQKVIIQVLNVIEKDGKKTGGQPYTLYTIIAEIEGKQQEFKTFSKTIGEMGKKAKGIPQLFEVEYTEGKYGFDIVSMTEPSDENAQS